MSPFERLIQSLTTAVFDPWLLVKLLFLVGLFIYVAFAVVVIRQVSLMSRTLEGGFNWVLKLVSWVHLLVAVGVWFLAWSIL